MTQTKTIIEMRGHNNNIPCAGYYSQSQNANGDTVLHFEGVDEDNVVGGGELPAFSYFFTEEELKAISL